MEKKFHKTLNTQQKRKRVRYSNVYQSNMKRNDEKKARLRGEKKSHFVDIYGVWAH